MFYYLFYELLYRHYANDSSEFRVLNVFRYVTLRTAFAANTALFLSLVIGPWMIRKLREFHFGQQIREEGPSSHQSKRGTPTMGGTLIVASVLVSTLLWADLRNRNIWIGIFGMLGFGAIGFVDDYRKVARKQSLGLTGRQKLIWQFAVGLAVGGLLFLLTDYSSVLSVPFFKNFQQSCRSDLPGLYHARHVVLIECCELTDGRWIGDQRCGSRRLRIDGIQLHHKQCEIMTI
jgi:phospho-N-acetylmuramoyl-pentapeptide-transferase